MRCSCDEVVRVVDSEFLGESSSHPTAYGALLRQNDMLLDTRSYKQQYTTPGNGDTQNTAGHRHERHEEAARYLDDREAQLQVLHLPTSQCCIFNPPKLEYTWYLVYR